MTILYIISFGILLTPLTGAILVTAVVIVLLGKSEVWGMERSEYLMVLATSLTSLLAVGFIWLFNYYHWHRDIDFLNQFSPNIDVLKLWNVAFGLLAFACAATRSFKNSLRAELIGWLSAIPGVTSILIYG
ncbi:MAG: hypothetical protein K8I00_03840 [Candidatus Omnitrophica bacterium]|nr:hypothetical protein [Candidatus Omnitrophota bacterium]